MKVYLVEKGWDEGFAEKVALDSAYINKEKAEKRVKFLKLKYYAAWLREIEVIE
jgi:hypothetical protein